MTVFPTGDPRATLTAPPPASAAAVAGADYVRFTAPAEHQDALGATWIARAQNIVIVYSDVSDGWRAERHEQADEYIVLLPDAATSATVVAAGETREVAGDSLTIVPPGDSRVTVHGAGQVVRVFTASSTDLAEAAVNADSYRLPHPAVAPLTPWPDPVGGPRIRSYGLDVASQPGRFGRIWRSSAMMINLIQTDGPRDTTRLSPHHHDDFEQCSLAVTGDFVHHLRWPWTSDLAEWREDDHEHLPAPSLAVIPPPAIHTTQSIGTGEHRLFDIFSPPRLDFSMKPGWVLNADEYPLPDGGASR